MITFHYMISKLKEHLVSYQLPFNQFSLNTRIILMDQNLSSPIFPDSFIFCEADVFAQCLTQRLPPRICFFVSAASRECLPERIPHNCNYIASSLPYQILCTQAISICQSYRLYQDQLSRTLTARKNIEEYLNDLARLTCSSCRLYNEKHQLLLQSSLEWEEGAKPDPINTEFLARQLEAKDTHIVQDPACGCYSCLERQSTHNHTFYLHFVCRTAFPDLDIKWIAKQSLSHILESIANYGIPLYTAKEQQTGAFIRDIMEETVTNWTEISERFRTMAHFTSPMTTIIYIQMPQQADALSHIFFLSELNRLFPDCPMGPYQNDLVLFHPNPDKTPQLDLHNQEFSRLLESYSAFAGCSMWTKFRFRTSIIMASANATFGKALRLNENERIFYHNDYSLYHMIDLAAKSFEQLHHSKDLTYLTHPSILRINRYDLNHHTNLLEILYYFLISGCNVGETAARLGVHRNTIQGKLNKLNDLIEDDYTKSGLIQCRLLVSCMIFFYQMRYAKTPFSQHQSMESSFKKL